MTHHDLFQRILLPLELTPLDSTAVEAVRKLHVPGAADLILIHVIEQLKDTPFDEMPDFYKDLE